MKLFALLVVVYLSLTWLSNDVLFNETLFFNFYAEQHTYEQIEDMLAQGKKWNWLSYAIIPFVYFIKISFTTICLSTGVFFVSNRFSFKSLFGAALEAEFIFLVPALLKILWFVFIQTDYSLKDLQLFYPLAMLNIFQADTVEPWLLYPLQILNIFEVIYCFILYKNVEKIAPSGGTAAVFSYLVGLLVWVAVIMFLTLTYSP
jgi:hypothetical protein